MVGQVVKGYKFKVTSSYTFSAEEGKIITVKIVAFERGGITTKLEERPAVRYAESVADFESAATAEAPANAPASGTADDGAEGAGAGEGAE